MATFIGKGYIHSLSGGTITCTGYLSPQGNAQGISLDHSADVDEIKSQAGVTSGLILNNDILSCTIELVPEGSTLANAVDSADLPPAGTGVTLASFPVIKMGGFADSINSAAWVYVGGGRINGAADGKWTMTLPLRRYTGITSTTAIA